MKKKSKILTVVTLLLFVTYYIIGALNPLQSIFIYIKHFSLFVAVGIVVYEMLNKLASYLEKRFNLDGSLMTFMLVSKTVIYGVILIFTSVVQINVIEYNDTPYVKGCIHYDNYNNVIYQSVYIDDCSNFKVLKNESDLLIVEDSYEVFHSFDELTWDSIDYVDVSLVRNVNIRTTIKYDDTNRIIESSIENATVSNMTHKGGILHSHSYREVVTKNDFSNAFNQTIEVAIASEVVNGSSNYDVDYKEFIDTDFELMRTYYTEVVDGVNNIYVDEQTDEGIEKSFVGSFYKEIIEDQEVYHIKKVPYLTSSEQVPYVLVVEEDQILEKSTYENNVATTYTDKLYYDFVKETSDVNEDESNFTYNFKTYSGKNYIIRSLKKDNYQGLAYEDQIYTLNKTQYGTRVEYLDYREDSFLLKNLPKKPNYVTDYFDLTSFSSHRISVFDADHLDLFSALDRIIYSKPVYIFN